MHRQEKERSTAVNGTHSNMSFAHQHDHPPKVYVSLYVHTTFLTLPSFKYLLEPLRGVTPPPPQSQMYFLVAVDKNSASRTPVTARVILVADRGDKSTCM